MFSAVEGQHRDASAGRGQRDWPLTVDGQISERSAGGPLNLDVGALQEKEYRLKCIAVDFSDI